MNNKGKICCVCNNRESKCKGKCLRCYYAEKRGHKTYDQMREERYILKDKIAIIKTASCEEFIIDVQYFDLIKKYVWVSSGNGYAYSVTFGEKVYMHRIISCAKQEEIIDHIDGNTFNNKKDNLRVVNSSQNVRHRTKLAKNNKSGKTGVCFAKNVNKWNARICIDKTEINLGYYDNKQDAIIARETAESKYFKEYSPII